MLRIGRIAQDSTYKLSHRWLCDERLGATMLKLEGKE
jgi:hypothetical protein